VTSDEIECCNLYWLLVSEYRTESFDLFVVWRPTVWRVRRAFSGPLPSPPRSWHWATDSQAHRLCHWSRGGGLCARSTPRYLCHLMAQIPQWGSLSLTPPG